MNRLILLVLAAVIGVRPSVEPPAVVQWQAQALSLPGLWRLHDIFPEGPRRQHMLFQLRSYHAYLRAGGLGQILRRQLLRFAYLPLGVGIGGIAPSTRSAREELRAELEKRVRSGQDVSDLRERVRVLLSPTVKPLYQELGETDFDGPAIWRGPLEVLHGLCLLELDQPSHQPLYEAGLERTLFILQLKAQGDPAGRPLSGLTLSLLMASAATPVVDDPDAERELLRLITGFRALSPHLANDAIADYTHLLAFHFGYGIGTADVIDVDLADGAVRLGDWKQARNRRALAHLLYAVRPYLDGSAVFRDGSQTARMGEALSRLTASIRDSGADLDAVSRITLGSRVPLYSLGLPLFSSLWLRPAYRQWLGAFAGWLNDPERAQAQLETLTAPFVRRPVNRADEEAALRRWIATLRPPRIRRPAVGTTEGPIQEAILHAFETVQSAHVAACRDAAVQIVAAIFTAREPEHIANIEWALDILRAAEMSRLSKVIEVLEEYRTRTDHSGLREDLIQRLAGETFEENAPQEGESLPNYLHRLRLATTMSQEALAQASGLSLSTIRFAESGFKPVTLQTLQKLGPFLQCNAAAVAEHYGVRAGHPGMRKRTPREDVGPQGPPNPGESIGDYLSRLRVAKNLTQLAVAQQSGLKELTVRKAEKSELTPDTLRLLAPVLEFDSDATDAHYGLTASSRRSGRRRTGADA